MICGLSTRIFACDAVKGQSDFYLDDFYIRARYSVFELSAQKKLRRLFKRPGVKVDRLGLSEITPEDFADHIAEEFSRIPDLVVIDVCAGLGGNTIAFAKLKNCRKVFAVDVDAGRLGKAKYNAEEIYKVSPGLVTWLNDDFCDSSRSISCDSPVVFISPPWGGKNANKHTFDLLGNSLVRDLTRAAIGLKPQILALYLPKFVYLAEIATLGKALGFANCVLDILSLGPEPKATVVYFTREKRGGSIPVLLQRTVAAAVYRAGVPGILGKFLASISFR